MGAQKASRIGTKAKSAWKAGSRQPYVHTTPIVFSFQPTFYTNPAHLSSGIVFSFVWKKANNTKILWTMQKKIEVFASFFRFSLAQNGVSSHSDTPFWANPRCGVIIPKKSS